MTVDRPRALGLPVGAASALAAAHAAQTGTGERTTTRASRRIAADPTSTALLLAGPTAMDLWPGVRRVGDAGGRVLVEAELPSSESSTSAAVRALPPRRTPTSFVTRFEWAGPGLPLTAGELTLAYAPGADGTPSTFAALELTSADVSGSRLTVCALQSMAEAFLDNLALAAEQRSSAA
ncbi:MAG: hypothetical protein Q8R60_04360 [Mycobacteriales bacterium]|nr:hypothetical protein [Mycobacteriales bacterium]